MLVDNYMYKHVRDKNIAGMEFDELLQKVHLGELDIDDLCTNERLDMSKELLGNISAPGDDRLSMSGMAPHHGRCLELCSVRGCSHLWVW